MSIAVLNARHESDEIRVGAIMQVFSFRDESLCVLTKAAAATALLRSTYTNVLSTSDAVLVQL